MKNEKLITFICHNNLDESVARLEKNTIKKRITGELIGGFIPIVVGSVSKDRVHLYYVIPLFDLLWKPHFIGRFEETNNQLILKGKFIYKGYGLILFRLFWWFLTISIIATMVYHIYIDNFDNKILFICSGGFCFLLVHSFIFHLVAKYRNRDMFILTNFIRKSCRHVK